MVLAEIVGTVVSTIHHKSYDGKRLMLCQPIAPDGAHTGNQIIALDRVQSGVGETVLILREGTGVRQLYGETDFPVRSVIVGIVDDIVL